MRLKMSVIILLVMFTLTLMLNIARYFGPIHIQQTTEEPCPEPNNEFVLPNQARKCIVWSKAVNQFLDLFIKKPADVNWQGMLECDVKSSELLDIPIDGSYYCERYERVETCPTIPWDLVIGDSRTFPSKTLIALYDTHECKGLVLFYSSGHYMGNFIGPMAMNQSLTNSSDARELYAKLKYGGVCVPMCKAQQVAAVIVPYSGPLKLLGPFLYHMHSFLIKQQSQYQIFVVGYNKEDTPFKIGELFNIGVVEAQRISGDNWPCLLLQEPSLLPLDSRNLYRCNWYPRQLVAEVQQTNHTIGGAMAVTMEQFKMANGFSNELTERVACYEDFYKRLSNANFSIEKADPSLGVYQQNPWNGINFEYARTTNTTTQTLRPQLNSTREDGLSSVSYRVLHVDLLPFYTHINVTVGATETEPEMSENGNTTCSTEDQTYDLIDD